MKELNYGLSNTKTLDTRSFIKANVKFAEWLNYSAMFQYETSNGTTETLNQQESNYASAYINKFFKVIEEDYYGTIYTTPTYCLPNGDIYSTSQLTKNAYNFRQQLNYNQTIGSKHSVAALLGQEVRYSKIDYFDNTIFGYDPELLSWPSYNLKDLASFSGVLGYAQLSASDVSAKREMVNKFVSFYGNGSYTYDNKYVVSGSLRWDRSNLWGTSSKYQNKPIWSVGASWNIDREEFFSSTTIDMLKLRATYGIGGNIGRNTAPYLIAKYYPSSFVDGIYGTVSTPPNKDIRWEKTSTFDLGVDFALFKNRLNGSVDYYHKNSVDLLAMINGSPTQGFGYATLTTNNGAMVNTGIDLTLAGSIIQGRMVNWNANLVYSFNKNKVTQIHLDAPTYDSRLTMPTSYPTLGNPYFGIYGYEWVGLNENGDPVIKDAEGNPTAGQVTDGKAVKFLGTSVPKHSGSFTNIVNYKNFDFSLMLSYAFGHKVRDTYTPTITMASGRITSAHKDIMNRWEKPGDEAFTNVPRLVFSNDQANYNTYRNSQYKYSDLFVYNASNIRISNISLAYRVPSAICQKAFLQNARLQFNVENLATIAFDSKAHYALGGKVKPNFVFGLYLNF